MFAFIKGTVEQIDVDSCVICNNDIGFKIYSSTNVTSRLVLHDKVLLHTYLHVKEDGMNLYGFLKADELDVFKKLINVSGIGPKGALSIMSVLTVDELRMAVLSEDFKAISKANGIGPKTAQRAIIELKDKFKLEDVLDSYSDVDDVVVQRDDIISEAAMALTSLGYSNIEALKAVKKVKIEPNMQVEDVIKIALKNLI